MHIDVQLTSKPGSLPAGSLGFGRLFTDHIFRMDWGGSGAEWHGAKIAPYADLSLDPAAAVLHYGQSIFEGLKAFWGKDGKVRLFRPDRHAARFATSAERLCMPALPTEIFVESVAKLVSIEKNWVPKAEGASLYVRPLMIATEGFLGVRPSKSYAYLVMLSPVDAYYATGFGPLKIWVEQDEVRAAKGGVGATKTAGNYAASLHAAEKAKARGYAQVLWLDAKEHKIVEEVGTMNLFVVIGDEVITPPLDGTILAGVTRASVLQLLREKGLKVSERHVTIDELRQGKQSGALREVFGTGTAAVISPVGELGFNEGPLVIGDGQPGPLARSLYEEIMGIQRGTVEDRHHWMHAVD